MLLNLLDYEAQARDILSEMTNSYYAGGASGARVVTANQAAFERVQIAPRVLVDVSQRELSTTVLGQRIAFPVLLAPVALAQLAHDDKEIGMAQAAHAAGTIMINSTLSNTSIEDLSQTGARLWFQLYVHKDRDLTQKLVDRAVAAGYEALVLTVDVPVIGNREFMRRHPVQLPDDVTLANLVDYWNPAEYAHINEYVAAQFDPALTWADVREFVEHSPLPVILKGIMRPDDARRAVDSGAAGVIVSNHGGRQFDAAPATLDALPAIATAISDEIDVLVDGGVRRGSDVLRALACGAKAVLIGRPALWGLAVDGQAGVEAVLAILRREYDIALALAGVTRSADVSEALLFSE
jgi:4-hydroxymandelate oxidase